MSNEKLSIAVRGEIVSSNFEEFREFATAKIKSINLDLKTDEDFEQAVKDFKGLKAFEDRLKKVEAEFLSQMDEVDSLLKNMRSLAGFSRDSRLGLERAVTARKTQLKTDILNQGMAAIHIRNYQFEAVLKAAVAGKSSFLKMQEAVDEAVSRINDQISKNHIVLAAAAAQYGDAVAYGGADFCCLPMETAVIELERRIERHRAALKEAELKAERDAPQREISNAVLPTAPPVMAAALTPVPADILIDEWIGRDKEHELFCKAVIQAFAPVKELRGQLADPRNIRLASSFATTIAVAFNILKEGGQQ